MSISVRIASLTFSGGEELALGNNETLLLVGPNNCGKSSTLKELARFAWNGNSSGPVLGKARLHKSGSEVELGEWLDEHLQRVGESKHSGMGCQANSKFSRFETSTATLNDHWRRAADSGLGALAGYFFSSATTQNRLELVGPSKAFASRSEPPSDPIQALYQNPNAEKQLASWAHEAFGTYVYLDRDAGSELQLYCKPGAYVDPGSMTLDDRLAIAINREQLLHEQGDGIRSYLGSLLVVGSSRTFGTFLDEPEAFLHPPQARLLGTQLVTLASSREHQLIVATHSAEFLRGAMEVVGASLRVARITRTGDINHAHFLGSEELSELLDDPLLRFSNALDGLFHDAVVICEDANDCRFYSALADATAEPNGMRRPDILFVPSGGKDRAPKLASALHRLGVPTGMIFDFDAFREEKTISRAVEAVGGEWDSLAIDWRIMATAIDQKSPPINANKFLEKVQEIINRNPNKVLSDKANKEIREALRRTSPWKETKLSGKASVPNGDPTSSYTRLNQSLEKTGVFVLDHGELERWVPSIPGHGGEWVVEALKDGVADNPALSRALAFVQRIVDYFGSNRLLAGANGAPEQ